MAGKHRFQGLLFDPCKAVEEPPAAGTGRKRAPMADMALSAAFEVYSAVSARRFARGLRDAHERGYLATPMHRIGACGYLEDELMTPVLRKPIVRSSLPPKAVGTAFAPDSAGFSTSRFVRRSGEKYGVERSGHDRVKAHAICGVRTSIVTAVEIHGRGANDRPQFKALVGTTAANFAVQEVPAGKAYLSKDNLGLVERLGGTAFVPSRANNVAGEAGTRWERTFHYYQFRRDEFLKHYHQRSNAASTLSMAKAKFRDHVRSKTDVAMRNEVLCQSLCHNICVAHQSRVERGIEPVSWADSPQPGGAPAVLPFARPG
jgi:transposase